MGDKRLHLLTVPITFRDGTTAEATAEGNNAAWHCQCDRALPLLGRCYFQYGHNPYTRCPDCDRTYRVCGSDEKTASRVNEIAPVLSREDRKAMERTRLLRRLRGESPKP